jgi:hypothetical protein
MTDSDERAVSHVETYRTPDRGEDHAGRDLPLGWLIDYVGVPEEWTATFVERGHSLRFRTEVDREKYGLNPPGYPGVMVNAGTDYWALTVDTDRVLLTEWFDADDDPADVVDNVEAGIEAVADDLERVRLSNLLGGAVPRSVVENLIDRFDTADRVLEIEDDTPLLESVHGIGSARREAIQNQLWSVHRRESTGRAEVEVVTEVHDAE